MCFGKKPSPAQTSPSDQPTIRPADDFAIIQQFNQLYMKVRAWSSEFLGGNNPSPSQLPPDVVQQIQRVLLLDSPSRVMPDKSLHRHIIEGLVGVSISETLNPQAQGPSKTDEAGINRSVDSLCATVLKFATPRVTVKQLKSELHAVFVMAITLSRAFQTQSGATFTVSYPKVLPAGLDYSAGIMDDRSSGRGEGVAKRQVGLLIFPGLFKATDVRTCMVKSKVVCVDEMERLLERTPS